MTATERGAGAPMNVADVVGAVPDPELPFLTIADLGILRGVDVVDDHVVVSITPTYSGCPAMREIHSDIQKRLICAGYANSEVRTMLQPAWTTDWITADGRDKLARAGIAPPASGQTHGTPARSGAASGPIPLTLTGVRRRVACPRCGSPDTEEISRFAATACQSLHRCRACAEPFNSVKEI